MVGVRTPNQPSSSTQPSSIYTSSPPLTSNLELTQYRRSRTQNQHIETCDAGISPNHHAVLIVASLGRQCHYLAHALSPCGEDAENGGSLARRHGGQLTIVSDRAAITSHDKRLNVGYRWVCGWN